MNLFFDNQNKMKSNNFIITKNINKQNIDNYHKSGDFEKASEESDEETN